MERELARLDLDGTIEAELEQMKAGLLAAPEPVRALEEGTVSLSAVVLGRREPRRARADVVCGIAAARLTLEVEFELRARAAAIAFDPLSTPAGFDELLAGIVEDTGAAARQRADCFGFRWVTLSGRSLDDLAISIGVVAESLDAPAAGSTWCARCSPSRASWRLGLPGVLDLQLRAGRVPRLRPAR